MGNGNRRRSLASAARELVAAVGANDAPIGDERREGVAVSARISRGRGSLGGTWGPLHRQESSRRARAERPESTPALVARIRNETFTSLVALNARLAELTADLNGRTMRAYKITRRELFERSRLMGQGPGTVADGHYTSKSFRRLRQDVESLKLNVTLADITACERPQRKREVAIYAATPNDTEP